VGVVDVAGAVHPVFSRSADRLLPADHPVAPGSAKEHVADLAAAPVEEVPAAAADDLVSAVVAVQLVVSAAAVEEVVGVPGVERVVATLAAHVVDPVAGRHRVVAPAGEDHVAAGGAVDGVVARAADDRRRVPEARAPGSRPAGQHERGRHERRRQRGQNRGADAGTTGSFAHRRSFPREGREHNPSKCDFRHTPRAASPLTQPSH
jgi:hypothetical protein